MFSIIDIFLDFFFRIFFMVINFFFYNFLNLNIKEWFFFFELICFKIIREDLFFFFIFV